MVESRGYEIFSAEEVEEFKSALETADRKLRAAQTELWRVQERAAAFTEAERAQARGHTETNGSQSPFLSPSTSMAVATHRFHSADLFPATRMRSSLGGHRMDLEARLAAAEARVQQQEAELEGARMTATSELEVARAEAAADLAGVHAASASDLWNKVVQEAQNSGAGGTAISILREIHHIYIDLHPPASTSDNTNNPNGLPPYPLCNIAAHRSRLGAISPSPSVPPSPTPVPSPHMPSQS
ncbi:hypothetical protein BC826DRAFT_1108286 [Russula brevipes]|nr:hypothetical protein BC826DRAFT_1108286 [Russula brevipes]